MWSIVCIWYLELDFGLSTVNCQGPATKTNDQRPTTNCPVPVCPGLIHHLKLQFPSNHRQQFCLSLSIFSTYSSIALHQTQKKKTKKKKREFKVDLDYIGIDIDDSHPRNSPLRTVRTTESLGLWKRKNSPFFLLWRVAAFFPVSSSFCSTTVNGFWIKDFPV